MLNDDMGYWNRRNAHKTLSCHTLNQFAVSDATSTAVWYIALLSHESNDACTAVTCCDAEANPFGR